MKKSIRETVKEAILPIVTELGYRIWDITYGKIGADYHLEITIDSDEGIEISDCEKVHRAIDPVLDEIDPIDTAYDLEVSSPGIERELRTDAHIDASIGEIVEARFFAPFEGKKSIEAILAGREGSELLLEMDGTVCRIPRNVIAKLQTVFKF